MASSDDINSTLQNIARQISQQNNLLDSSSSADFVTPEQFGASDPLVDSYTAFQDCINAGLSTGKAILLKSRVYLTSQLLDFQTLFVFGTNGAIIRALTNGMLVVKNGNLNTVEIDGNFMALWGWLVTSESNTGQSPSSVRGYNVLIDQCTEWGFISDNIQNATFVGMFCESNFKANMVLANGSANIQFFNCTMYQATADASTCNLLYTNNNSNPHGFGLSTDNSDPGDITRHCDFFGGIMEGANLVNNIMTTNPAGLPNGVGGTNSFYEYEFDGKVVMLLDSTFQGVTHFFSCEMGGQNDGSLLVDGAGNGAEVFFHGYSHGDAPGGYGPSGADLGIECGNNVRTLLNFNMSNFASPPPYGAHGAILTVDWVASQRTLVITNTPGSGHIDMPEDNAFAIGWRTSTAQTRLGLVRVSISISTVGSIDVVANGSGNVLMTLTNTDNQEVVYRFRNNDTGTFGMFPDVGVASWQLSNFTIEYL